LSAVEQTASAGNAIAGDETTVAATAMSDEDAIRPLPPAGQELASLLASNQAPGRPADTVAALAAGRPEEAVREVAAIRAGEPAGPANGGTPTQAGAPSSTSVRPEAAASLASLPTTPDVLNLNQKNWERTLGHQLNWMVNNRLHEAEIKVNPPDLGPLEVRVSQHHNQTSVTFFSHEAAVREALENALPRLREMLDSQGISLNQAQVSDQSLARQQAGAGEQSAYGRRDGRSPAGAEGSEPATGGQESPRPRVRAAPGAVDDYA
jgi:flagellar hook-length control protein FliK